MSRDFYFGWIIGVAGMIIGAVIMRVFNGL